MDSELPEALRAYTWANEPEYGILERDSCACKHPFTAREINRHGEPWGGYRVEAGNTAELMYTVVLFDLPTTGDAEPGGLVRFWIRFRPPKKSDFGFMMDSGESSTGEGVITPFDRDQALAHPRIEEAWELIDWLFVADPMMHQVMAHDKYPTPKNWPGIVLGDDHVARPAGWRRLLGRRG